MTLWWRSSTSVRNKGLGSTENWHSTKVLKVNNEICNVLSASVKFSQTVHFLSQNPIFLFCNPPSLKNSKSKIDVVSVEVGTVCGANLDKWEAGLVLSNMMLLQNKQMLIMSNMMFLQNKQMLELWESTRAYSFCLLWHYVFQEKTELSGISKFFAKKWMFESNRMSWSFKSFNFFLFILSKLCP